MASKTLYEILNQAVEGKKFSKPRSKDYIEILEIGRFRDTSDMKIRFNRYNKKTGEEYMNIEVDDAFFPLARWINYREYTPKKTK